MKTLKSIISITVFIYLILALYSASFNVNEWNDFSRVIAAVLTIVFSIGVASFNALEGDA